MQTEKSREYTLWRHAILQQDDTLQTARFAASGTIMRDSKVVAASGVLDASDTGEEAETAGLSWCRVGRQARLARSRRLRKHPVPSMPRRRRGRRDAFPRKVKS